MSNTMNSTQNNFIVLDYEGNEVFSQTDTSTNPSTPRAHRYNLRSRTSNYVSEPQTPQKQTRTTPLLFCGGESPQQTMVTVEAVAIDSVFNDTTVYETDDGSIVLRGFTRGLEYFTDRGATEDDDEDEVSEEVSEEESEEEESEEEEDETDAKDLSGFTYESYGRGYLLYPPMDHPAIGEKYFFDAWWMPKFDAWFFKDEFLEDFESLGVENLTEMVDELEREETEDELTEDELTEDECNENDLSEFCYIPHGRGYLLFAPGNHPSFGTKYFHNAWWMPKHDAWFFRKQHLGEFTAMGAVEG